MIIIKCQSHCYLTNLPSTITFILNIHKMLDVESVKVSADNVSLLKEGDEIGVWCSSTGI